MRPAGRALSLSALCILMALPASAGRAQASSIAATGTWSASVGSNDLQAGAGSDLQASCESPAGQVALTIMGTASPTAAWQVDVQRNDILWPQGLSLSVLRAGDGLGPGSISGGTGYQSITSIPTAFFSGQGDRSGISLQLKIGGLSVRVPPGAYSTTITYTVIDQ